MIHISCSYGAMENVGEKKARLRRGLTCRSPCKLSHHLAHLGWCIPADYFDITDPGSTQCLFLHCIAGGGVQAAMMAGALKLDGMERAAVSIDNQ